MKIIEINGGIGRCIAATAALENHWEKTGEKIIVLSPWSEIFFGAPYIHKLYNMQAVQYLFDDVIRHGEYMCPEPYQNHHFYNQRHSISESFDFLINGEVSGKMPKLYLTDEELAYGKQVIEDAKKASGKSKVVALQAFGSSAKLMQDGKLIDESNRSLTDTMAAKIADNPKAVFINLSHIPFNHPNVWQQPQMSTRQVLAIVAASDAVVSIDSMINHAGVALNKDGLLIMGSTFVKNFGYSHYRIFQREGYPKSYAPLRFPGFVDLNQGAMNFNEDEQNEILRLVDSML